MTEIVFNAEELNFISDKSIFERKASVTHKVTGLMNELQRQLQPLLEEHREMVPSSAIITSPKISRGENYLGFPWLVLDYPRLFTDREVFAFRTLFWWGHAWVFTFQCSGNIWTGKREQIIGNLAFFNDISCRTAIGSNPWIHDPDDAMYSGLDEMKTNPQSFRQKLLKQEFFKLIRKTDFSQTGMIIPEALKFYRACLRLLGS